MSFGGRDILHGINIILHCNGMEKKSSEELETDIHIFVVRCILKYYDAMENNQMKSRKLISSYLRLDIYLSIVMVWK